MTTGAPVIVLTDVNVSFRLARQPATSFKDFGVQFLRRRVRYRLIHAVRSFNLTVHRGEVLGIIGPNGAGKSTLTRVLGGILPPTSGRVVVRGRVTPILDLGVGLHPELTGLENLVTYGALLGGDIAGLRDRAPHIAEWAGLSDHLDQPLRTYSSGMVARLAFAVATDAKPEILLLDEVFAVGDAAFQRRSLERITRLVGDGATALIVSHDLETLEQHCSRLLWMRDGSLVRDGDPTRTIAAYRAESRLST